MPLIRRSAHDVPMRSDSKTACRLSPRWQALFDKRGILTLIIGCICAAVLVVIDQLIKAWLVNDFALSESREWLKIGSTKIMNLTYVLNSGAAFSSFSGRRVMLILIPVVLTILCLFGLLYFAKMSKLSVVGVTMVLGGGVGNLIDRIFNGGEVIDYLDVQLFDFAVFNFADVCICVGVALVAFYLLILEPIAAKKAKQNPPAEESAHE